MTAPDDMIEVPRRLLEALVLPASSKSPLAKYHDELREMADATVRVRKLLEPPTCPFVVVGTIFDGINPHCVLPAGHHTMRTASPDRHKAACIRCDTPWDDPIHKGDAHQVDPALWVEKS